MTTNEPSGGVNFSNFSGGVHDTVNIGGNVSNSTISLGGQPTPANKQPTPDELKQLLAEIRQELAEVMAQKEALQQVDAAAPSDAQSVEARVNDALAKVEGEVSQDQAESVQKSLTKATGMLGDILDGAKTVAEKAGEVGQAVKPLADTLVPLVEKLGVAALWVSKLWLMG